MIAGLATLDRIVSGGLDFNSAAGATGKVAPAASFAGMLAEAAGKTVATLEGAEALSVKALTGEAQTRDVVDAVMSAEQSLQTAIAIRDKIVTAWLEVSRMQI
jgi:flagellar hook-basal body complex protein FliE